jgi:hypothetical protein
MERTGYEAPAVEDRVMVDEPLSIVANNSEQQRETPVWRTRDR